MILSFEYFYLLKFYRLIKEKKLSKFNKLYKVDSLKMLPFRSSTRGRCNDDEECSKARTKKKDLKKILFYIIVLL